MRYTAPVTETATAPVPETGAEPEPQPIRVLVVDDEEPIRRILRTGLCGYGFSVETADSGREALQILMQQSFEVLVVDLKMQGMDGIVFLQEALKIWPWIGVIVVSGYVNETALVKTRRMGVRRVLQKPVSIQELDRQIRAEVVERQCQQTDIPHNNALSLMRDHLKLLTRLDEQTIATETLVDALLEFGRAVADMMPSDVVGILVLEGENRALLLAAQTAVSPAFLSAVETEMTARYEALSGQALDMNDVQIQIEGRKCDPQGAESVGSTLSVPVILGGTVCGLLSLAVVDAEAYTPSDVSLLYHAANHISTVFVALRKMHTLATRDPLTGALNRIRLEEELERAWNSSRRYNYSMGIVIVDIDYFKTLNDSYGHVVGDEILRDAARLIQTAARASDVIARYGGDEFVAILPRAEERDARHFGERLLQIFRSHVFCENTHRLNLTLSIGIATSLNPSLPATGSDLLSQADRALYMAKRAGRDRICIWPERCAIPETGGSAATGAEDRASDRETTQASAQGHVLVVDDEVEIRTLVSLFLRNEGFRATCAAGAQEALDQVRGRAERFDVLLTDLVLGDDNGVQLLQQIADLDDSIVPVIMTGNASVGSAIEALRHGAYDFIEKPLAQNELGPLMRRAVEYRNLKIERARYGVHLEEMVRKRSAQLARSLEEVRTSYDFTLQALVAMLDAREHQTGIHSSRTRELAVALGERAGLSGSELEALSFGAFLHDIGKIGVPDSVLLQPGPLQPGQWDIMKQHPEIGYNILRSSPYLQDAARVIREHHEHFDGTGYPHGLRGRDICIGARVFSVVDAYDAMRSERVYRDPISPDDAAEEIRRNAGKQFDPEIVELFLESRDELERILTPSPA